MILAEIWITPNGQYKFYEMPEPQTHYLAFRNEGYEGLYDSLAECREYTIDFDNLFGDGTFSLPEQD